MREEQPVPVPVPVYPPIPDDGHHFVDASGYGFATGLASSSILSLFRGLRRGGGGLAGAAGTLAAYFALCSAVETAISTLARPDKEDLWNGLAAGAVSWAALGVRRGAAGAALVALGVASDFADGRIPLLETPRRQQPQPLHAPTTPATPGFLGILHGPPIVAVGDH